MLYLPRMSAPYERANASRSPGPAARIVSTHLPGHDIIVVGASAGGVEALISLARGLPPDLPAAVFTVLHIPAEAHSLLPNILSRAGPLPAVHPADGDRIEHGRIYVAPPDRH